MEKDNIVIDENEDISVLQTIQRKIKREKILTAVCVTSGFLAIATAIVATLAKPVYLSKDDAISVVTSGIEGDKLVTGAVTFTDEVTGYKVTTYPVNLDEKSKESADSGEDADISANSDKEKYVEILAYYTKLDKLMGRKAIPYYIPNGISAVVYASHKDNAPNQILTGKDVYDGETAVTLSTQKLGAYAVISLIVAAILGVIMFILNKVNKLPRFMTYILLLPVSYVFGFVAIKGFDSTSYNVPPEFLGILVAGLFFYICLASFYNFKEK